MSSKQSFKASSLSSLVDQLESRKLFAYTPVGIQFTNSSETVNIGYNSGQNSFYFSNNSGAYYAFTALDPTTFKVNGTQSTPYYINAANKKFVIKTYGGNDKISVFSNVNDSGHPFLMGEISAGDGADTISGGLNCDNPIFGGAGNDVITSEGSSKVDDLYGGDGNDTITSTAFDRYALMSLYGEGGDDILTAKASGTGSSVNAVMSMYGGTGDDKFYAPSICATMEGNEDDDTFTALNGFSDIVIGDSGYDVVLSHDLNPGSTSSADLIQTCEVIN